MGKGYLSDCGGVLSVSVTKDENGELVVHADVPAGVEIVCD